MQHPEVRRFNPPSSIFQVTEEKSISKSSHVTSFDFYHLVSVTIPDHIKLPQNIIDEFTIDTEYYKIFNFNVSELLNTTFLEKFVKSGQFSLLNINTRIDCDDCIAVSTTGILTLVLNKETFQTLGLEGNLSHYTKRNKDKYIVALNLKDGKLTKKGPYYEKTKTALNQLNKFNVIITWYPSIITICPSSIAKYFSDLNYNIELCKPTFHSHIQYTSNCPLPFDTNEEMAINEFIEWLGLVSLEGDLDSTDIDSYVNSYQSPEPNDCDIGQIRHLQWRGFYLKSHIEKLIELLKVFNEKENKVWIALYVQGFSDMPNVNVQQEHDYYTNGDVANILIFNQTKSLCCNYKGCLKKYK